MKTVVRLVPEFQVGSQGGLGSLARRNLPGTWTKILQTHPRTISAWGLNLGAELSAGGFWGAPVGWCGGQNGHNWPLALDGVQSTKVPSCSEGSSGDISMAKALCFLHDQAGEAHLPVRQLPWAGDCAQGVNYV